MGTFNVLNTKIACVNCKVNFELKVQFKFGDTWQYTFKIGDELKWGGNDVGSPSFKNVIVYGITGMNICPNCNHVNQEEFDLVIINNKIHSIRPMESYQNYFTAPDSDFYVIE